jgi:hypothetical protein
MLSIEYTGTQGDLQINARHNLYTIYDVLKRFTEVAPVKDELIVRKIRKGEIFKNDKRFDSYRTVEGKNKRVGIPLTGGDDEWLKETAIGQFAVIEEKELFRLRAEVSERVEQRKAGLASILDF